VAEINRMGGTLVYGAPYHPQTQGVVERVNRTIKDKLKAVILMGQCFHSTIQMSPYLAEHGEEYVAPEISRCLVEFTRSSKTKNAAKMEAQHNAATVVIDYQKGDVVMIKSANPKSRRKLDESAANVFPYDASLVDISRTTAN